MDGYTGEIKLFGGPYPPRNWAFCSGQTLNISQYTALFAVIGTSYGGDGRTNFQLPKLNSLGEYGPYFIICINGQWPDHS